MEIRHPAVAIALLVTFGAPVPGKADKIDDYVTAQIKRLHVPGTSLAVVRDGHITKAQGYGFANLELRSPATKETVYEIGSTSKQFTATAIMMLVGGGQGSSRRPSHKIFSRSATSVAWHHNSAPAHAYIRYSKPCRGPALA